MPYYDKIEYYSLPYVLSPTDLSDWIKTVSPLNFYLDWSWTGVNVVQKGSSPSEDCLLCKAAKVQAVLNDLSLEIFALRGAC